MLKKFNVQKESFSMFSASLVAGDTAILTQVGVNQAWLGHISGLLQRGIVVRTPDQASLDIQLRRNAQTVEQLARLAGAMDRKVAVRSLSVGEKERLLQAKKLKGVLEAKAHQLIKNEGFDIVEACRKVRCRPSDYYIYRSKLK